MAYKGGVTLMEWKSTFFLYEVGISWKKSCYGIIKGYDIFSWESKSKLMAFILLVCCFFDLFSQTDVLSLT